MQNLAKNQIGSVDRCPHKIILIHLGGGTLYFEEEVFLELVSLLNEAKSNLVDMELANLVKGLNP